MVKRKRLDKKKRSTVRERDWEQRHETSFTHDLARHRRAMVKLPEHSLYHETPPESVVPNATVVSHTRKWAFVLLDQPFSTEDGLEDTLLCLIDERLDRQDASLLAPGDRVLVEIAPDGNGVVRGIGERHTALVRHAGVHGQLNRQIIAANVEMLVIVAAATHPPFCPGLIDRFLIVAQLGGVTPMLCVNKMDLVDAEPAEVAHYRELGLTICNTSCKIGEGINHLRDVLHGKTSVFAGHSGVGKSSLLNCLDPELRALTREVSEATRRGRHATTASKLYQLAGAIRVIDTPGIRTLGLWDVSPETLAFYFPEMVERGAVCKFRNCTHIHEPGCGVRAAVDAGDIAWARYDSYKRIRAALESQSDSQTTGKH